MSTQRSERSSPEAPLITALARWEGEGGAPERLLHGQVALGHEQAAVLRRLGAAVIVRWNDLPTDIQRELFDRAVSTRDIDDAVQLKERVARFLHRDL